MAQYGCIVFVDPFWEPSFAIRKHKYTKELDRVIKLLEDTIEYSGVGAESEGENENEDDAGEGGDDRHATMYEQRWAEENATKLACILDTLTGESKLWNTVRVLMNEYPPATFQRRHVYARAPGQT